MTVVVAYIPTPQGEAAIDAAIIETRWRKENLIVVNITRGDAYVDRRFAQESDITAVQSKLDTAEVSYDVRQTVGDDPVHGVLAAVKKASASLLVVGIRHRTAVGKLFMGSVAQQLLLNAPCPVLAVKDPAEELG